MMEVFILLTTQSSVQVYFESERAEGLGGGKSPCIFTDTLQPGKVPAQRPSWEQPPPAWVKSLLSLPVSNDKGKLFPSAAQGTAKIRFLCII